MLKVICPACIAEGDPDPQEVRSRGLCPKHYQRANRAGAFDDGSEKDPCPRCVADKEPDIRVIQIRGMCRRHYLRARKSGELEGVYASRLPHGEKRLCEPCLANGKSVEAKAHGLCPAHVGRRVRGTDGTNKAPVREPMGPTCTFEGCGNANHSAGLCGGHAWQKKNGRPLTPLRQRKSPGGSCEAQSHKCPHKSAHEGLCNRHYQLRLSGDSDWDRPIKKVAPNGSGHVDKHGYRFIQHEGRKRPEHCVFVEQLLGRPLDGYENVHHRNGSRADNRTDGPLKLVNGKLQSGNLELWSKKQPAGQEIGPKLEWALEMLEEYAEYLPEEHRSRLAGILKEGLSRVDVEI